MPLLPEKALTAYVYTDSILIHLSGIKLQTIRHNLNIFVNYF